MVTIRPAQMQSFERERRSHAHEILADYALARFPAVFAGKDRPRVLSFVERVFDEAGRYGMVRDDHVALILDFLVMYGMDFAAEPWAAPILKDPGSPAEVKAQLLRRQAARAGVQV